MKNLLVTGGCGVIGTCFIQYLLEESDFTGRIVNVDKQVLSRINLNWQLMLSAGIGYSLTDRIAVHIEPTFSLYMSPEYENVKISTQNPYSIGFRAGIIYKLNK